MREKLAIIGAAAAMVVCCALLVLLAAGGIGLIGTVLANPFLIGAAVLALAALAAWGVHRAARDER